MSIYGIDKWSPDKLRPHPENGAIFGDPEESDEFTEILASIKADGIREPLCVKGDGTILSGHLRLACALKLGMKSVPVRVWPDFKSYLDEVKFVVGSNTERRHLKPSEIAFAFKRLKEIPRERGGAKANRGPSSVDKSTLLPARTSAAAAKLVGVSEDVARAAETVFTTDGVPPELKSAVNSGKVAPTTAAKAVRAEMKSGGGTITHPERLRPEVISQKKAPAPAHDDLVAERAAEYARQYARLLKAYREVDQVLSAMPLKTVIGPTEHHEYTSLIRDVSLRAWREIESVQGPTTAGKQMALTVIQGGK